MRIGVLSDIHIDRNAPLLKTGERYVDLVVQKVEEEQVDLFLIAGDISNDYAQSLRFLHDLEARLSCKVLFVPGNHDYWSKVNHLKDTYAIYDAFQKDRTSLLEKPYIIGDDWAIVGNSGWYDHSFADTQFSKTDIATMSYKGRTWQDKWYVHWNQSNEAVHRWFYDKIEADLQAVADRKIIFMTHMVTHRDFIVPMPHDMFGFFNAFLGSDDYQYLHEQYPIHISIMGHVHYRKELVDRGIHYICACLGNANEWRTNDPKTEIADAFVTVTLTG